VRNEASAFPLGNQNNVDSRTGAASTRQQSAEMSIEQLRGEVFALDYPCQICLPQQQITVSIGCCLVNCALQMGQGLVITYVMAFTPPLNDWSRTPITYILFYHVTHLLRSFFVKPVIAQEGRWPADQERGGNSSVEPVSESPMCFSEN
jgi:hypothetical protein